MLLKYKDEKGNWVTAPVVVTGDVLPEEAFIVSGNCQYRFANNGWSWFIEQFGDKTTTKDISSASSMFYDSDNITEIPFDLNFNSIKSYHDFNNIFQNCTKVIQVPKINNLKVYGTSSMFYCCFNLRTIPEDIADTWNWSYIEKQTSPYIGTQNSMFYSCYSLRSIPMNLIKSGNPYLGYNSSYYYNGFWQCFALDELINLPIPYTKAKWTSNAFIDTFRNCYRLKNVTFKTNDDGTAIAVNWKGQIIDLTNYVGYTSTSNEFTNFNSGITADKRVTDATSYEALKNDPDWFTADVNYSRYNHDSAVNTINSLPDASAYLASYSGTNTIKFRGSSGTNTDGGAINTLTDAEIAVATAKGWTVTFV